MGWQEIWDFVLKEPGAASTLAMWKSARRALVWVSIVSAYRAGSPFATRAAFEAEAIGSSLGVEMELPSRS